MSQSIQKIYALGYDEDVVEKLKTRSVAREGSFLLPYLQKGGYLLDAGCGPGSITLGLAQAIHPGRVIGIDLDSEQIRLAQEAALAHQIENVEFREANIYDLDFPDETFDAVFAHTLFMHLPDPQAALKALHRMCKQQGILGIRDGLGGFHHFSNIPVNDRFQDIGALLEAISRLSGNHPDIGVRLKGWLIEAGFGMPKIKVFSEVYDTPQDMELLRDWYRGLFSGSFGKLALEYQLVSEAELRQLMNQMEEWPSNRSAISVISWVEYVAQKL